MHQAAVIVVLVLVWCRCEGKVEVCSQAALNCRCFVALSTLGREGSDTSFKRGGQAQKQTEGLGKCRSMVKGN